MARKKTKEGRDFHKLKKLGFEFDSPQDEYSYQPDSGGAMDGIIGEQEYGIKSNPDATSKRGIREQKRRQGKHEHEKRPI